MTTRQSPRTLPRVVWDDEWKPQPQPGRRRLRAAAIGAGFGLLLVAACVAFLTRGMPPDNKLAAASPVPQRSEDERKPILSAPERRFEPGEVEVTEWSQPPAPPVTQPRPPVLPRSVAAPAVKRAPGYLSINATPWAEVSVDGRAVGNTPLIKITVAPGRHHVVLARDGFQTHSAWVIVEAGGTARLTNVVLKALDR